VLFRPKGVLYMRGKEVWRMRRIFVSFLLLLGAISVTAFAEAIDLALVIDASGSINNAELALEIGGMQRAVTDLFLPAANAGAKINIAVVCFSTTAKTLLALTPLNAGTVGAINAAVGNAGTCDRRTTNMGDALNSAIAVLASGTAPRQVINLVSNTSFSRR
jgi:hypothetical protein